MRTMVKSLAVVMAMGASVQLSGLAMAQQAPEINVTDTEIRIGNVMPYTGELAAFASIGKTEAAYFDMINERGGINGRKIKFISYDNNSDSETASEQTRKLIDEDKVLLLFGSFGTPGNLALRPYVNQKKIPQLFIASGDHGWGDPKDFPWTMGWQPSFRAEGRIYANYIQASYPESRIAVLWQNDQFGRDLFSGLQEGLGDLSRMIISDVTFDRSDKSIDSQVDLLQSSGAEILIFDGAPAVAALAIRRMNDIDWHPVFLLDNASASIANALRPAGLENSIGVISTAFLKDAGDPAWKDDPAMKDWSSFMDKYYPDGDKTDGNTVFGYAAAETLFQVLKQCGDDFSRENIMRQATSLKSYQSSVSLPGIVINTSPTDFHPIKQMRLVQFDGSTWQPIGEVIESAFLGKDN
ncbi:ABC transporter substrate-binding protein [Bradyrhizobium canariense]|uniref:ABC-type branched-chain amino acid transport system, substrate-binding protein n=1 Tax=Bradyrhizobium canariense TaxID=255045 RepID=A0A1H2BM99_9BRAD|nr:ABC transporter substrate-binding protein [Bradyrhizobium canariense]SDT59197.1 ABC-type branched-chain amino acid transport system, substrate-binding protein [Bradyrhizobium canariense]